MTPVIKVSEISSILVRLRKRYIKNNKVNITDNDYALRVKLAAIQEVRNALELRRRSREGVTLYTPYRKEGKCIKEPLRSSVSTSQKRTKSR